VHDFPRSARQVEGLTIESCRIGGFGMSRAIHDLDSVADVLDAMKATVDSAREDLRRRLVEHDHVLAPGVEPLYEMKIHVAAIAAAWPSVPGITGPDWELLEERLDVADFSSGLLARMFDITSSRTRFDTNPRRLVWARHPAMIVPAVAREYFRFVDDERIPPGHLRLAREV
jgi:hypothetical protein